MEEFCAKFEKILTCETVGLDLILEDAAGNSYVQSLGDDDPHLKQERYTRSWSENETLGLNDLNTENYHAFL